MFSTKELKQISYRLLFLIGAVLGAICFIGIYGVKVLDFTNTGWLFFGDNDLRQHYIAWCHFRSEPWRFPFGLMNTLSYPDSMSVIYTDSIPIFAVFFKLYNGVMPESFQYFGLFGILSFMLMGGLSAIFLRRFIDDDVICIIGSLFYILSFQVIHRMYYHTALAAQWIIILALIIWVYDEKIEGTIKKGLIWAGMGFLCVAIHSYYLAMVGMVLAALMVCQYVKNHVKDEKIIIAAQLPLIEFVAFCVGGLFNLWILGAFDGEASASGYGLGTFSSNLNTFVNSMGYTRLIPGLPVYYDFQYEGFGYLGAGILFLYIVIAIGLVIRRVRKVPEKAFHQNKIYGQVTALLVLVSFMAAVLPDVAFGSIKIIHIPYPQFVQKILGIFRSNGRLVWVAVYVFMTAGISFAAYTFRRYRPIAISLILFALVTQIMDGSKMYKEKHDYFTSDFSYQTMWDDPDLAFITNDTNEFIFLYTDNDITLETAYYGYLHGNRRQNNYYFARDIDDKLRLKIEEEMENLRSGNLKNDAIYVITEEMYQQDPEFYNNLDANIIRKYNHIFISR